MPYFAETLGATAFLAGGIAALYATFVPQAEVWCRNISRGSAAGDAVALTFDDGPTPGCTDRVLEVLAKAQVPAAFFVIGQNVQSHPDLLRQVHAAGHVIGNHTFDHHHFSVFRGPRYWGDQLRRTNGVIEDAIGVRPRFFRPPVGIKFIFTAIAARREGHAMVTWTRRGRDGVNTSADQILGRLARQTRAGDIITLHDGVDPHHQRTPDTTLRALPELITRLRDRGLKFARLDELIGQQAYASASSL